MMLGDRARNVMALITKDLFHGSRSTILIMAVVLPLVISLALSLMMGTLFADQPRLGVVDLGRSQLPERLMRLEYLAVERYDTLESLEQDVARGALDMGTVLPADIDEILAQGANVTLDVFVWGESLIKHRTILGVTLVREVIDLAGRETLLEIVTTLLGEGEAVPWEARILPLIVILTLFMGGILVPATSLVGEKEANTLRALLATPVTMGEVLLAKGILGILISTLMGVVILSINRAFGLQPGLMIGLMALSAVWAAEVGVILGVLMADLSTLFAIVKGLQILIFAPALIYLFPDIPQWVARIFPTYYTLGPLVEISLHGASWTDIAGDVYILLGLLAVTFVAVLLVARRTEARH